MPAKDLGTKHLCWKCNTKFYDLKKADPVCPKCGADPRQAPVVKSPPAADKRAKAKPAVEVETPELDEVESELDEAVEDEAEDAAEEDEP
jgi:uncharacterized protein (TIGR02300 family)